MVKYNKITNDENSDRFYHGTKAESEKGRY